MEEQSNSPPRSSTNEIESDSIEPLAAATGGATLDDFPEPDYESLDLSFDDIADFDDEAIRGGAVASGVEDISDPNLAVTGSRASISLSTDDRASCSGNNNRTSGNDFVQSASTSCGKSMMSSSGIPDEPYILGTLIVRVVAARNLESVGNGGMGVGGPLGKMFFGHGGSNRNNNGGGTANPYASVRFGSTTQRTTEVFGTTEPIWPRGETMYMDVVHPPVETYESPESPGSSPSSSSVPGVASSDSDTSSKDDCSVDDSGRTKDQNKQDRPSSQSQPPHPGDPPKKQSHPSVAPSSIDAVSPMTGTINQKSNEKGGTIASLSASDATSVPKKGHGLESDTEDNDPPPPILTVAIFHASEMGKLHKFPTKGPMSGDSDDVFLGMTAVNLTQLLTGKIRTFDEWLPLSGTESERASVRVVCEYEASDVPPHPGDLVQFSRFCHPADLYPVVMDSIYKVEERDGDSILISSTSPEGWVSSFLVHRFMLICVQRRHGALDFYQDEMVSIAQRLSHSPLVNAVQDTVSRVPQEGLLTVGGAVVQEGVSLLSRWFEGGPGTIIGDIAHATNWDGRFNPNAETSLSTEGPLDDEAERDTPSGAGTKRDSADSIPNALSSREREDAQPLPNMPACPITQEPMIDPVVAADGHTYERSAIVRWLKTSDKSPLTGSVLPHKNLVPNYMLLSSLQEASSSKPPPADTTPTTSNKSAILVETVEEDSVVGDDVTTEVEID